MDSIYTWIDNNRGTLGDTIPPTLTITAPTATTSGSPTYTTSSNYTVSGTASDDSGISSVTVNGTAAELNGNNWSLVISLNGDTTTTLTIVATDGAGNKSTATRYVRYDANSPVLTVNAPTGTSSSSPTVISSDVTKSYTVSGTVSDASGIKSVTVNGSAATISGSNWNCTLYFSAGTTHTITIVATDITGRTTTVTRYLQIKRITLVGDTIIAKDSSAKACGYTYPTAILSKQSGSGNGLSISNGYIVISGACTLSITATFNISAPSDFGKGGGRIVNNSTGTVLYSNITIVDIGYNETKDCTFTTSITVSAGTVLRIEPYANITGATCNSTTVNCRVTALA